MPSLAVVYSNENIEEDELMEIVSKHISHSTYLGGIFRFTSTFCTVEMTLSSLRLSVSLMDESSIEWHGDPMMPTSPDWACDVSVDTDTGGVGDEQTGDESFTSMTVTKLVGVVERTGESGRFFSVSDFVETSTTCCGATRMCDVNSSMH